MHVGCKKAKEEISVNADTNIISPLLRNVFKFQSGSHNVCFSFSFANRVLVLEYRAALGPSQELFCPVLTLQRFEAVPLKWPLWLHFKVVPFILFFHTYEEPAESCHVKSGHLKWRSKSIPWRADILSVTKLCQLPKHPELVFCLCPKDPQTGMWISITMLT